MVNLLARFGIVDPSVLRYRVKQLRMWLHVHESQIRYYSYCAFLVMVVLTGSMWANDWRIQ